MKAIEAIITFRVVVQCTLTILGIDQYINLWYNSQYNFHQCRVTLEAYLRLYERAQSVVRPEEGEHVGESPRVLRHPTVGGA